MANSNGWGDGAANNSIGWGQGANNSIGWGDSHAKSWAGLTDIVGIDSASSAYFTATGITGATQQTAIDNLVKGLKADGLWSKMKAVYPFVTDNRNRLSYTNTLTNAYWQKTQIVLTSGQSDVNGGTNATKCAGSSATNAYIYGTTTQTIIGQTYTASVYLRGDSSGSVSFRVDSSGISPSNPINYTTSWQRFTYTFTALSTNADWVIGGYSTWTGSETIYVYAPQLELGSTATTYQPIATTQQAFISSQFKYNLVNPVDSDAAFRLVFNGGWTHSSNGATPNGTNGYADTKLVPSSVLTQNSTHLSFYSRSNILNTLQFEIGSFNVGTAGLGSSSFGISYNSAPNGHMRNRVSTATPSTGFIPTDARGLFTSNRTLSTQQKAYQNGVLKETASVNSDGLSTLQIAISANRISAVAVGDYSAKQTAFSSIGDGLTDTEAANLYTRVQAFQTSLSRQV